MKEITLEARVAEQTPQGVLLEIALIRKGDFWKNISVWLPKGQTEVNDGEIRLSHWQWEWRAKYRAGRWKVSAREEDDTGL